MFLTKNPTKTVDSLGHLEFLVGSCFVTPKKGVTKNVAPDPPTHLQDMLQPNHVRFLGITTANNLPTQPNHSKKLLLRDYFPQASLGKRKERKRKEKKRHEKKRQENKRKDKKRQEKTRKEQKRKGKKRKEKTRKDKTRQDKTRQNKKRKESMDLYQYLSNKNLRPFDGTQSKIATQIPRCWCHFHGDRVISLTSARLPRKQTRRCHIEVDDGCRCYWH